MPKIIIDGREYECRDNISVLQAALEAGIDVPHYCYHPALSVVGSCRLCLMEMKIPDPKANRTVWGPKLVPSCQTPVHDGLEVRFESDRVKANQRAVMEDLLLNHPLDCPICDQAGECWLQDYSLKFGTATSRMVEEKIKNPKKDIGPRTLLYQDRCVMCSRCVRFTQEISGTGELCVVNRGSRCEIDVFPGRPLDNRLQGNVVDICPVGSLLDKSFLFAQRVWLLANTPSICPACSTGCAIFVDHNDGRVYRLRPRFSPKVNEWWMCDDGRFGWKHVHDERRITAPFVRDGERAGPADWGDVLELIRTRMADAVASHGDSAVAVQLSPMMACEEAWLLATWLRKLAPGATLTLGDVPAEGADTHFPLGASAENARFTIRSEKVPNRRGIEMILAAAGGNVLPREQVWDRMSAGGFVAVWIVGGYPRPGWASPALVAGARKCRFLVVQDLFPSELTERASVVLPACAWIEREGTFVNAAGLLQPIDRAIAPPEGARADGRYLYELAGHTGLYTADRVREMMIRDMPAFGDVYRPPPAPRHQH